MNQPIAQPPIPVRGAEPTEPLLPQADWPRVYRDGIVWDAHACLPLLPNYDCRALQRHRAAGATFVSVNVGMDFNPLAQCIRVIAGFRDWIGKHPQDFILAETLDDVRRAKAEGKLAVAFDLEGSMMLDDDLAMLGLYRDLGVRQMHLAYNRDNPIAGGCFGRNQGLSDLGREVVRECNRVGIVMDCSHSSRQTSLDVMAVSSKPVVFSHSNAKALCDHPRNIDDVQIKAAAATGGLVCVTGIGPFLGRDIATETLLAHIDHMVKLVGVAHVGIGIDYSFDTEHSDLPDGEDPKDWWPPVEGSDFNFSEVHFMPPERLPFIALALLKHGYSEADTAAILGGNFMRVAGEGWS
ncbi:membrane dipeptidase [Dongia mobilis]|uniref:Membrane dipeptidase n=1 Tax=Dongia mobilis TaxID=578943 RepID=A0A4R6WMG0_9PROT|nr:dipeptidase [Dongia mobilis]TDQ82162.1 membrane dipeptidase [Dongia mobilis]